MNFIIQYLLPPFYLVLIAYILQRNRRLRAGGVEGRMMVLFFLAKCVAGFLYSYIALHYIPNRGDIWLYYDDGLELFKTLLNHPTQVDDRLREMFSQGNGSALDSGSGAARSAFEGIKFLHFIFNFFSWGNLYTNTIFFNGIASVVFIKCWIFLKNEWNSWIPGAWLFLFPSAFFYTAGIHKEGIMFILIAILVPGCYHVWQQPTLRKFVIVFVAIALFAFFKLFVAALFTGAIILFWMLQAMPSRRILLFYAGLLISVLFFFASEWIWPAQGLPSVIVHKQQEFLEMEAASGFSTNILTANMGSFLKALPGAIYNALFRPMPGQGGKVLYYVYTLEIFLFWAFVIYMAIKSRLRMADHIPSMVLCLFVFAIANLLIIGYTIPNIGATMRYRSIFLPFVGLFAWWVWRGQEFFNVKSGIENKV